MRLNELTGIKNHPIGKAAREIKPSGDFDKVFSAYDPGTMENLKDLLRGYGWRDVGFGYYGMVFRHHQYPYVVKVFVADTAYAEYFNIIKHNQSNPHVPKVRGNFMRVGDRGYAVRLEKLDPLFNQKDPIFSKYIDPRLPQAFPVIMYRENEPHLKRFWPKLYDLIQQIKGIGGVELDWHVRNVMSRGDTLVITDPVAM